MQTFINFLFPYKYKFLIKLRKKSDKNSKKIQKNFKKKIQWLFLM